MSSGKKGLLEAKIQRSGFKPDGARYHQQAWPAVKALLAAKSLF